MKVVFDLSVTSAVSNRNQTSENWDTAWYSPNTETTAGLVLDFVAGIYGADGINSSLAATMSLQRNSDGSRTNSAGALEIMGQNIARIDHDPVTLAPRGLLLEPASLNKLTQSNQPGNQTIQVNAVSHVLSFYGTGTVNLSGANVSVTTGSAGYPTRTSFGFTPTSGNLNIDFSGSISNPQIEEGTVATSYIPTAAIEKSRSHDIATVDLGNWFNPTEGTLVFGGSLESALANDRIIEIDSGASSTRLSLLWNTVLGKPQFQVWSGGNLQAAIAPPGNSVSMGEHFRVAIAYSANDFVVSLNGGNPAADTTGVVPTSLTTLRLGRSIWGAQGLLVTESLIYYPTRLSNSEVQALST